MRILLLAAMDKEINLLLDTLQNPEDLKTDNQVAWLGKIGNHGVLISKCGIGKINSGISTFNMINQFHPDLVINSGVAGGAGVPIGTLLIADRVAYHDVWCGPGTIYGQADGFPLYMLPSPKILNLCDSIDFSYEITKGLICSGDKFISTPEEIKFIKSKFPDVKAVDMESASIAQVCNMYGIPFAVVRVVSDTPGEGENISQYKDFWKSAPSKTFMVLTEILKNLK